MVDVAIVTMLLHDPVEISKIDDALSSPVGIKVTPVEFVSIKYEVNF